MLQCVSVVPLVRILGPVTIDGGQSEEALRPRLARLLGVLAIHWGSAVSSAALIDAIWAEADELPDNPARSLQTYVSRLRGHLGPGTVERIGDSYRLADALAALDATRFEDDLAAASRARAKADDAAALELIVRALSYWSGPALGELATERWATAEAHRLNELQIHAEEERAELRLGARRADGELVADLEALARAHPHRERATRLLMLALYSVGRQADALAAFSRHQAQLATDLGLEPSEDLRQLENRILTSDPALSRGSELRRSLRDYELSERLGEGAFSIVYRGSQLSVEREVAIKQIRAELANRPEFIRRFEAEAHLVARLEHPYIVPLIDYWREPGSAYLVMRYLRGGNLETALRTGAWDLERAQVMAEAIGDALETAHRAGVVHRDVKPANILLDEEGRAYLTDFGIALEAAEATDPEAALSAGSPAYASPEQLRRQPVGPPADVHGLAITVYETLTGQLPFPDEPSQAALLQRQLHDPIPPISDVRGDIPSGIDGVLARATEKHPDDRYQSIHEFLDALKAISAPTQPAARRGIVTAVTAEDRNPYKGLRAFDEADAADFAGRERLVDQLLDTIANHRLVAVVGPSGSGKSSTVRAGLLPALRAGGASGSARWFITTLLPGSNPFDELEAALLRVSVNRPTDLLGVLTSGARGIARGVRHVVPDEDGQVLLVIDQFEELFTLSDPSEAARLLDALAVAVAEERSRLRVVLTLRADFFDRPLRHEAIGRLVRDATVPVLPLAADELEHAIVDPAAAVGAEVEPGLVSEIVADVVDQPGALPLLQYALTELYDRRVSGLLTRKAYHDLGGVAGALGRRADDLYQRATVDERATIRRVFGRLVSLGEGSEDTRRRALRGELGLDATTHAVLARFGSARLLSFDHDPLTRQPTVEVAHEALLRQWPRFRQWLDEDRDDLRIMRHLTTAADEWARSGRPDAELYRGGRLESAESWMDQHQGEVSADERAFLERSIEIRTSEQERDEHENQRLRRLLGVVAVVAAIALVAGVLAGIQQRRARESAIEADANAARAEENAERAAANEAAALEASFIAETGRLQADAARLAPANSRLSLLLAAEAYRREPSSASLSALQQGLINSGGLLGTYGGGAEYTSAWFADDDRVVATTRDEIHTFDEATGQLVDRWAAPALNDRQQAFGLPQVIPKAMFDLSPAGIAVYGTSDGEVIVLDPSTGVDVLRVTHDDQISAVTIDTQGRVVASADVTGRLIVWDLTTERRLLDVIAHPYPTLGDVPLTGDAWLPPEWAVVPNMIRGLAVSADGQSVVAIDALSATVWDVGLGHLVNTVVGTAPLPPTPTGHVVLHNREVEIVGDRAVITTDKGIIHYDLERGATTVGLYDPQPNSFLGMLFATPHAGGLVGVMDNGGIQLVAPDGQISAVIDPQVASLNAMSTNASGTEVLVATGEGVLRWSLTGAGAIRQAVPRTPGLHFGAVTPDGRRLTLDQGFDSPVMPEVWDLSTERPRRLALDAESGDFVYVVPGGAIGTFEAATRAIQLLDPDDLTPLGPPVPTQGVFGSSLSPDHQFWSSAVSSTGAIQIYEVESGETVRSLDDLGIDPDNLGTVVSHSFDPAWARVAGVHTDGTTMLWDVRTGEAITDLDVDGARPEIVMFSRSGRYLGVVGEDGLIHLLDGETLEPEDSPIAGLGTLLGYAPDAMAFSADDRYLLTTADGLGRLWDIESRKQIGDPIPTDATFQSSAQGSADGALRLTTADASYVYAWTLEPDTWPELACVIAGRNLTLDEWEQFGPSDEPYQATCDQWEPLG